MNITREKVEELVNGFSQYPKFTLLTPETFLLLCNWALNRDTAASAAQGRCIEAERELASALYALAEIKETVEALQKGQVRTITETDGASEQ